MAAALLLLLFPSAARAGQEAPSPELLQELRQRLTRPAPCEPHCVSTPALVLRLGDSRLDVSAEVHAAADGSWALPGPVGSWTPAEVKVDGAAAVSLARLANGFLHLRLARGVHRVEALRPGSAGDSFTLQFADPPRRARAEAPGLDVSGLRADGPAAPSISLHAPARAKGAQAGAEGRYAPWLEVTRTLGFGVTWTVTTEVRRVTPTGAPSRFACRCCRAKPRRARHVVEKGGAAVSLGGERPRPRGSRRSSRRPQLVLKAPEGRPWSEVRAALRAGRSGPAPRRGCRPSRGSRTASSLPSTPPAERDADGGARPPAGVEGQTLTIDDVSLEDTPGRRPSASGCGHGPAAAPSSRSC